MLLSGEQLASRLVHPSWWAPASPPLLGAQAHHQNDGGPGLTPEAAGATVHYRAR